MANDDYKRQAAERALTYVESGMKLGLGTGSTAAVFVALLGEKVKAGLDVICVATSEATATQARALGIKLTTLDDCPDLDLVIDGADEVTDDVMIIKGGGGALLREKIVASASSRLIIIADASKRVQTLGKFPLPVEVVPFGLRSTKDMIIEVAAGAGCVGDIVLRLGPDKKPFVTDSGNYILDCAFEAIDEPDSLDMMLKMVPGVVENGLFLGMAERAIIAGPNGIEELESPDYTDFDDLEDAP
jgi:ribose 5-phosphate isomerase A